VACRNRRHFARSSGLRWRSFLRVCFPCWQLRQARLHIAGRVALLLLGVPVVTAAVIALGWGIGALVRGLMPLVAP
jgi:hypothetical protein